MDVKVERKSYFNSLNLLHDTYQERKKSNPFSKSFKNISSIEKKNTLLLNLPGSTFPQSNLKDSMKESDQSFKFGIVKIKSNQFENEKNSSKSTFRGRHRRIASHKSEDLPKIEKNKLMSKVTLEKKSSIPVDSPSKWRKIRSIVKGVQLFKNSKTVKLLNDVEVERNIDDYREFSLKKRKFTGDCASQYKESIKLHLAKSNNVNNELLKLSLKEKFLELILDGEGRIKDIIDTLFSQNPERYLRDEYDERFLFNERLHDGRTLMYVACRESKLEILKYMIYKKLNPYILSKIGENEFESCLQVSVRWCNKEIVDFLLEKIKYSRKEIIEAINCCVNQNIRLQLYNYLNKHHDDEVLCVC